MGKCRENNKKPVRTGRLARVGRPADVPSGRGATVVLKDGTELALFNLNGNFYAIENFCPHKGYEIADSPLAGNAVVCEHHDWRFDVRTGAGLTAPKCPLESYEVVIEDGWLLIRI
jgi:nitrite reductase/ring-hydroxylating ferredoxin subunit